jgi:hypothetical protein
VSAAGTIPCPAGKHVLGGGWTTNPVFSLGVFVLSSGPVGDGSGWTGAIQNTNTSGGTVHITLSAVCATVSTTAAPAKVRVKSSQRLRVRRLRIK